MTKFEFNLKVERDIIASQLKTLKNSAENASRKTELEERLSRIQYLLNNIK